MTEVSATTQSIIDLLKQRDAAGRAKYGTTLDRTDLSHADWLQHAAEEALDQAGYLLAAKREAPALIAERDAAVKELRDRTKQQDEQTHVFLGIMGGVFGLLKSVGAFCDLDGINHNGKPVRDVIAEVLTAEHWTQVRDAIQGVPK